MNSKIYGRKLSWPNFNYYPDVCLGTQEIHEIYQDRRRSLEYRSRDSVVRIATRIRTGELGFRIPIEESYFGCRAYADFCSVGTVGLCRE